MPAQTINDDPLAIARRDLGLSQREFAEAAGIGVSTVSALELGLRPGYRVKARVLALLGFDPWADGER